jgi:hypothetical protein
MRAVDVSDKMVKRSQNREIALDTLKKIEGLFQHEVRHHLMEGPLKKKRGVQSDPSFFPFSFFLP